MSMSKRILFEKDPRDEPIRAAMADKFEQLRGRLTLRIPTRRKNPLRGRHWDPLWPNCLSRAAAELELEAVRINDGLFVTSDEEAERIMGRAQELWELRARGIPRREKRISIEL